jgi:transposase
LSLLPGEPMNNSEAFDPCGVEVSAEKLHVLWRSGSRQSRRVFSNDAAGHGALRGWLLGGPQKVRVCMESTGLYGLDVALALSGQEQLEVMVANPRAVRHFAAAQMRRSKSDPIDTEALTDFAERMKFRRWIPPSRAAMHLHALARRIGALVEMQTAEKNRQHAAGLTEMTPAAVRRDLLRSVRSQQRAIDRLTVEALRVIATEERLAAHYALLLSVPGIAQTSAVQILAELAVLSDDLQVRQWVAYGGLDPREYTSGSSVQKKTRISKAGNSRLRRALYMPALVAAQRQPHLRAFYRRLLGRGKTKMQSLVAVMRKLLHAIFGMFRSGRPFNGAVLVPLAESEAATTTLAEVSCR